MTVLSRERLRDALRRDEGTGPLRNGRFLPYKCSSGKLTIGYGRNIEDRGISAATAEQMLNEDIDLCIIECASTWPWFESLSEPRQAAMVNLCFNLGMTKLKKFPHTLRLLEAGDFEGAAIALLQSRYAEQVGDRALRIAEQLRRNTWV